MSVLTNRMLLALYALLLYSVVLIVEPVVADTKKTVRTNPFAQPLVAAPSVVGSGAASSRSSAAVSVSRAPLQLRGVLRAGANSFANIDGKIVGLNETVFGMRLKSVSETAAVFVRNGKNMELKVSSTSIPSMLSADSGTNSEDSR